MIRRADISEFLTISRQHKTFLWHFIMENQCEQCLGIYSYFEGKEGKNHLLKEIIDQTKVPYFESFTKDSIDFLIDNGIPQSKFWQNRIFGPIVVAVKNGVIINHTGNKCYCPDGVVELISELDINYLEKSLS